MTVKSLLSSALEICNNSKEIVVYGFKKCKYLNIKECLEKLGGKYTRTYSFDIGMSTKTTNTLNGNEISKIEYNGYDLNRMCKSGLVNIVFENYKRKKRGEELIPVLFCIDVTCNLTTTPLTAENLASKEPQFNSLSTFKELRRAYKLCMEIDDEEIRAIATETFKFVKVNIPNNPKSKIQFQKGEVEDVVLTEIKKPWDDSAWTGAWARRREESKRSESKKLSWIKQLKDLKRQFDDSIQSICVSSHSPLNQKLDLLRNEDMPTIETPDGLMLHYLLPIPILQHLL